jgi:hypothetical protein
MPACAALAMDLFVFRHQQDLGSVLTASAFDAVQYRGQCSKAAIYIIGY